MGDIMTMEHVIKINNVVCPILRNGGNTIFVNMYGKTKQFRHKSGKLIEQHVLTSRFMSRKVI